MLRRHIVLLIVICPSDRDVKSGGPLHAFQEEQAMSWHQVSPSPFLSSYDLTLVPHIMWFAQAVRESKIDHTQRHLSALCGTPSTYSAVGSALEHTHTHIWKWCKW